MEINISKAVVEEESGWLNPIEYQVIIIWLKIYMKYNLEKKDGEKMNVTDKELLTFCNLTNLKMEYADLGKDRDEETQEILVYHTIYSLLEKEVLGIDKREKTSVPKKLKYHYM